MQTEPFFMMETKCRDQNDHGAKIHWLTSPYTLRFKKNKWNPGIIQNNHSRLSTSRFILNHTSFSVPHKSYLCFLPKNKFTHESWSSTLFNFRVQLKISVKLFSEHRTQNTICNWSEHQEGKNPWGQGAWQTIVNSCPHHI